MEVRVGLLALQGDFAAHGEALRRVGARASEVRRPDELQEIDGLIVPGGESTTLLKLMQDRPWFERLRGFVADGGAVFGTCAGAILLAKDVQPAQPSLGLLDVTIRRNAYGSQVDSFETDLEIEGGEQSFRAVFIRAPQFRSIGEHVEVLARLNGEPVLVRQGKILAGTFHPELTNDDRLHREFVELAGRGGAIPGRVSGGETEPRLVAR
jgi:5'-phosphate synthase pdxT subunit